jgi:hypothetical protein
LSGILDSKTRVLDAILTSEGRQQLIKGKMNVRFVSFSDIDAVYESDTDGIFIDRAANINLEAFSTQNDEIFQTTNEAGRLRDYVPYDNIPEYASLSEYGIEIDDFLYHQLSHDYAATAAESFKKQHIIFTYDKNKKDSGLSVNPKKISFSITDDRPFKRTTNVSTLNDADSLFADKRLSNTPTFLYLPPIQKENSMTAAIQFGEYANFSENNDIGSHQFLNNLKMLENSQLEFSKLTEDNDIVIQFYESKNNTNTKLDVINYGKISMRAEEKSKNLYFVGKLYFDDFEVPTFINIFTVII